MGTAMRGMRQAAAGASRLTPGRGARWGALGGLAGTAAMDVALIAALSAAGLPALSCYSLVGDTVARFFALLGIGLAGGIPLGIAAHYVIGPVIGAIYGAAAALSGALRAAGLKRNILWAILYVELVSQPLLVSTPILLRMPAAAVAQWYGMSTAMHAIAGAVLGLVLARGLRGRR